MPQPLRTADSRQAEQEGGQAISTPHKCPTCLGEKRIFGGLFGEQVYRDCPTCNGKGVLWEPETPVIGKNIKKPYYRIRGRKRELVKGQEEDA